MRRHMRLSHRHGETVCEIVDYEYDENLYGQLSPTVGARHDGFIAAFDIALPTPAHCMPQSPRPCLRWPLQK